MTPTLPYTRDLVLVGGGHAHALVLRSWGMRPLPGARLTLVNPDPVAPYTGMLPGLIAGHYRRDALMIDLVRLARYAGARLVLARAEGIDLQTRRIHVSGRAPIGFDVASLDIGITAEMPELPGFAAHGHPAKPLGPFATAWEGFLARCRAADRPADLAVLGGGVAGVELAMAMAHRLRASGMPARRVNVIEAGAESLRGLGAPARERILARAATLGVTVLTGRQAVEVTAGSVRFEDGAVIPADFVAGAAGARPHGWLEGCGLALERGFVVVDAQLATSDPAVFAAGDCAHFAAAPLPKAGVYAVRAAPILGHNLRAALSERPLARFRPQRHFLKLVSAGGRVAVAERGGRLALAGGWLWRLKDRIDRRFMARFEGLAPMAPPPLPARAAAGVAEALAEGPLCGGCGAKVSQRGLRAGLAALAPVNRPDILSGPGDDAAILAAPDGAQVLTTDHFRAFIEDHHLLARIAAVHAMGDVWAMGGRPQAVLVSVILPRMSERMQADTLREILDGAAQAVRAAGAEIVGGHSSIGAELTVGFTVTGICDGAPVGLGGARPGDALILTRPLGSGTLLAGEMRLAARGEDVAAALAAMSRPQGEAAACLAPHARAMTDVTGFGLAGHLHAMLEASGSGARINLAGLPLLAGADRLAEAGIRSSLWRANRAAAPVTGPADTGRAVLLHDPQTAGGLLAAVPAEVAPAVLGCLHAAGETRAAVIGRITEGPVAIVLETGAS